jgi:hypothetical protein
MGKGEKCMKYLDRVKVISDDYEKNNIKHGDEGHIIAPEIRYGAFLFIKEDPVTYMDCGDAMYPVKIEHLELVKSSNMSDEAILNALPLHDPNWYCKLEDGYIVDLKGRKKNKIPYDYKS